MKTITTNKDSVMKTLTVRELATAILYVPKSNFRVTGINEITINGNKFFISNETLKQALDLAKKDSK